MNIHKILYVLAFISISHLVMDSLLAQQQRISDEFFQDHWDASWIAPPDIEAKAYGVYHFRKTFTPKGNIETFVIHVSADNRYQLFVNGELVGRGPARGNLYNWLYETYDLTGYLKSGENVIAAQVWNMGEYAPVAQISNQTAFLVQGDNKVSKVLNTDSSWKVVENKSYKPISSDFMNASEGLNSYLAIGANDEVHGKDYPWGWFGPDFDDSKWKKATIIHTPVAPLGYGTDNKWTLVPREIPQMEENKERIKKIRRSDNVESDADFLKGTRSLTVAPNTKATLLLDQGYLTTGYPTLTVSKGNQAKIKLTYAETLYDEYGKKRNRDEIFGKTIKGLFDIFYPDGGNNRAFTPLWIRTWRYIQLDIETKDSPLKLDDIYGVTSIYPYKHEASFSSNDSSLDDIWEVGWRTARLGSGETFFDSPYYEQLQYEGDARIQALISLYNSKDDRLVRKAINDFFLSRAPNGLTQGRYPSNKLQIIPPYSLYWISMLYDYWMLSADHAFLEEYLDAAALILKWYEKHIDDSVGMLGPMKWWNFTDYSDAFPSGIPDGANDGNSSVITLHLAYTLQQAAELFKYFDRQEDADHYADLANELNKQTYKLAFDKERMEMANQPDKKKFSQHASIMAILSDAIPTEEQKEVMTQILEDGSLGQVTFYYRFYLTQALVKARMADLYYSHITPWRDMIEKGLTTFAEKPDPARSDSHAWSASPNYDFLATICGIRPDKPGFEEVKIEPALGDLKEVTGKVPLVGHKEDAFIKVDLKRQGKVGIQGTVELPKTMKGRFLWNGKTIKLKGGIQEVSIKN